MAHLQKKKYFKKIFHTILQFLIFGKKVFQMDEYKIFKKICDFQNRQVDVDVMRHIITFNLLNKYKLLNNSVCIIGDGKANFVGGLLGLNKNIKIFSINLSEVLIHDYLILQKTKLIDDDSIIVVKNKNDLLSTNKKLFLIDASNAHLLENQNINLFVNIASMQEMKLEHVKRYFKIISSNKAYFYCCNREYKKLSDGQELIFDKYPWEQGKFHFYEDCPWQKKFYDSRPPFIKRYDGNVKHTLVKY